VIMIAVHSDDNPDGANNDNADCGHVDYDPNVT